MKRAEPTPGPWFVETDLAEDGDINVCAPSDYAPLPLARVDVREHPDETEAPPREVALANALLMAAAPELLDALRGLVKVNEDWNKAVEGVIWRPIGWTDSYLSAARTAIAKAEGR